eukprot:5909964-Amphidinium_carterae.1
MDGIRVRTWVRKASLRDLPPIPKHNHAKGWKAFQTVRHHTCRPTDPQHANKWTLQLLQPLLIQRNHNDALFLLNFGGVQLGQLVRLCKSLTICVTYRNCGKKTNA